MIPAGTITTYAQYNEDIVLKALLHDVEEGFYIDVGANYDTTDSVTKLFYIAGWSGINIEPLPGLYKKLVRSRERDMNLNCGLSDRIGKAVLREYPNRPGHSTFESSQKKVHDEQSVDHTVGVTTLSEVYKKYVTRKVNFIKIDVEGFEYKVVAGNEWDSNRPEVICIEANHISKDWRSILTGAGYRLFIMDGLNEYYISKESWWRTDGFAERAIELDYHSLKDYQKNAWEDDFKVLNKTLEEKNAHIKKQDEELLRIGEIARHSLKDQTYMRRVKRATYGLSLGWIRDRLRTKKLAE